MRQKIRKTLIFISFLLFPVTIWYFSPALIIQAASEHIMNGSFFVFTAMLVGSLFLGRVWCGWLCPAGGLQECAARCNDRPARQGQRDKIKFVIWIIWIVTVIVTFVLGKNRVTIDFFFMTDHGISVTGINNYVVYYGVLFLLVLPVLFHGRRAACHYLCWMAPFMIIGSTVGRFLHLPQLHIEADPSACVSCGKCSRECPMGLDVPSMAEAGKTASCTECTLCGACVDACPKKVLKYRMVWRSANGKRQKD